MAFRLRRSGRSSPATPPTLCADGGGAVLAADDDSAGTPGRGPLGVPRGKRVSLAAALLHALVPTLVLLGTLVATHRHEAWRGGVAEELLAEARQAIGGGATTGARQLGEAQRGREADGRACADALKIPQVAMLFLVKGPLRHEAMWRAWFERAAGLLPAQAVSNALCATEDGMPDALAACSSLAAPRAEDSDGGGDDDDDDDGAVGAAAAEAHSRYAGSGRIGSKRRRRQLLDGWFSGAQRPPGLLDRQHLFDVYVHPHPNFTGYKPGSLLYGHELPDSLRVTTEWGTHTLVDAAESLLAAAVKNPRNQKFFMLSESDLPLYSPHVMYLQLMSEHRSRLNSCNTTRGWDLDFYRWVERMEHPFLQREQWRKSSQWFVLNRKHVEVVLQDSRVERVFRDHCHTTYEADRGGEERVCYSDEHYIPTLLATHGLDNETDCQGRFMDVDWSRVSNTSPHPWEYTAGELKDSLFDGLRRPRRSGCGSADAALAAAPGAYIPQEELFAAAGAAAAAASNVPELEALGRGVCRELLLHQQERPHYAGIGPECPLMARKFSDRTVKPALKAMAACDSTTLILNDGRCPGETERQRYWRRRWWRAAPWLTACSFVLAALPLVNWVVPLGTLPYLLARSLPRRAPHLSAPLLDV